MGGYKWHREINTRQLMCCSSGGIQTSRGFLHLQAFPLFMKEANKVASYVWFINGPISRAVSACDDMQSTLLQSQGIEHTEIETNVH